MKIRTLCRLLPLLLSSTIVQASYCVKNDSSAIWSLQQLFDLSGDPLPQDLLKVLGQTLADLERHGVWINGESGKRWVPFTKVVEAMKAFRDGKSSEADILAVSENKEKIKEGLLLALSARWDEGLEEVMKDHVQIGGQLNPGKAYGASFLAYHMIELSVATDAAYNAALNAAMNTASNTARNAAWIASTDAAGSAARNAARNVARDAVKDAVLNAVWIATWKAAMNATFTTAFNTAMDAAHASVEPKVIVLASTSASEFGQISYDLAELFTLLWLTENGHEYLKRGFDAAYENFPEMELAEVKAVIEAAIKKPELKDNMFIKALWRDLEALERFVGK